jgi:hypothetical protein
MSSVLALHIRSRLYATSSASADAHSSNPSARYLTKSLIYKNKEISVNSISII